ncbi:beta-N-acetylglucosaminidase domain-containing protein [Streptomyces sp. TRM 70351]|uniref:beta-N-acetylglucosaminidase domain-containing protein n=1 Tax=Streptomyces sp. TRM 70351 TaxID=3116552 RepID=UPI003FCC762F
MGNGLTHTDAREPDGPDGPGTEPAPGGAPRTPGGAAGRAGRRAGASALVAAVVGALLGGASGAPAGWGGAPAHAAPLAPQPSPAAGHDGQRRAGQQAPAVWPRPQHAEQRGSALPLPSEAVLVAEEGTDAPALAALREALHAAGVATVRQARPGGTPPPGALEVAAGGPRAEEALRVLGAAGQGDLPPGGYRLATGRVGGRVTVALAAPDGAGLFHAAQTLRQLTADGRLPQTVVRDWPAAPVRGTTEGFYGQPWTHEQRLALVDFLARTKQNRFLYAPGDDPYRAARWRDPYPAGQRAAFRELAERARAGHVTLAWAVSPGQRFCFASAEDRRALLRKLDGMWALGFRAVQLRFDDVSYTEWHCEADADAYGRGPQAAATAQAELAGAVLAHLLRRSPGQGTDVRRQPLSVLPTEFYQEGRTEYRAALAGRLDDRVQVAWSGVGVVPRTITGRELGRAREAFAHPLVTLDNYPVNDYAEDRLFLGPYTGREPAVAAGSAALLTNAMEQPVASRVPLFTAADFAWNPRGYRPEESWRAAVADLAGSDGQARSALRALAGNGASSMLGGQESAYLRPLLDGFDAALDGRDEERVTAAARRLREAFTVLRTARGRLADVADGALVAETAPWLEQLARYGTAGEEAVDLLLAQRRGDGPAAWRGQLAVARLLDQAGAADATVGDGVLDAFLRETLAAARAWTGAAPERTGGARGGPPPRPGGQAAAAADGDPATRYAARAAPRSGTEPLTVRLPAARPLEAVTVQSGPGSGTEAAVEVHAPGSGWRRIGELDGQGFTHLTADGARADAIRLVWLAGSAAPVVHEVSPWYADTPGTSTALARAEADAVAGGPAARAVLRLTSHRPRDVAGRLTVRAPEGFTVRAPRRLTVPRGATTDTPLVLTADEGVRPGSHRVPVVFTEDGGERRELTLTVRVGPRTDDRDLALGARAESSADETPDFPAAAVTDGDPATRWSSPPADDAWVRVELPRPARVGAVTLHWQDAYAAGYRVEVSADGRSWRTAATVRDGRGGRETVRLAAPGEVRYVRISGERRGTEYGYSLWSVAVHPVAGPAPERPADGDGGPDGTPEGDRGRADEREPDEEGPDGDGPDQDGPEEGGAGAAPEEDRGRADGP